MPTRAKSAASKKSSKQLTKQQEKDRVDAWMQSRGHGAKVKPPASAPPTPSQVKSGEAAALREKFTPSGIQRLIGTLVQKKKKDKK